MGAGWKVGEWGAGWKEGGPKTSSYAGTDIGVLRLTATPRPPRMFDIRGRFAERREPSVRNVTPRPQGRRILRTIAWVACGHFDYQLMRL